MNTAAESGPSDAIPATVVAAARALFGEHLPLAEEYARWLVTEGVTRGLIGPREAPRIWDRHLLNCAAVAELLPAGVTLIDVGSGAGLPGLPLAIAGPDLTVTLVESMARRTDFLTEVVAGLGLEDRVSVVRARAEECVGRLAPADVVTARALAPLDRLAAWCLPLAGVGGRVLAVKGESAPEEVAAHAAAVRRMGGATPVVRRCGVGVVEPATTVIEILRQRAVPAEQGRSSRTRRGAGARRRAG